MRLNKEVSPDTNVEAVREELLARSITGLRKYGLPTSARMDIDLPGWIQHMKEELLDASIYLQAMKHHMMLAERLIKLMHSYNPHQPMGHGMRNEFLQIRDALDALSDPPVQGGQGQG